MRKNLRGILLAADKEAAAAKEAATAADKEAVAAAEAVKKAAKAPTPSGADKKPIAAAKTSEQIGGRLEKPPPPNQKPPSPAHKPVGPNRKGTWTGQGTPPPILTITNPPIDHGPNHCNNPFVHWVEWSKNAKTRRLQKLNLKKI